jgi:hypothetical protein
MAKHPPYSMVLTYTEDPQRLIMQVVDAATLAPLVSGIMEVPFFLDDEEFKFDDELGASAWSCNAQRDCIGST